MNPYRFRSLFISDVHLGARDAQGELLLDLLRHTRCDYIYLIGDIVDMWMLKRKTWNWTGINNEIFNCILEKSANGTRLVYIPGNHDECFREYVGASFNQIKICRNAVHVTAQNKRLLLIHGDEFDSLVMGNKWLIKFGDHLNDYLVTLNRYFNFIRRKLGFPYWSLAAYLKSHSQQARQYIESFEKAAVHEARRQGMDGVICGHIHHPAVKQIGGISYANSGDWVENYSAIVERENGELDTLFWTSVRKNSLRLATQGGVLEKTAKARKSI